MANTDFPIDVLRDYAPNVLEPSDFDEFWSSTIAAARQADRRFALTPAPTPITQIIIEDLTFSGYGGEPIKVWVSRPANAIAPPPGRH